MIATLLSVALTFSSAALQDRATRNQSEAQHDFYGATISIEWDDETLEEVLRELARQSELELVVQPEVDTAIRVSVHAQDAPWDRVLDSVLRGHGLVGEWDGRALHVRPAEQLGLRPAADVLERATDRLATHWDDWPSGREEGIPRQELSPAELRALLEGRIETGEWYGRPYRACSFDDRSVWISMDGGEAQRSSWDASFVVGIRSSLLCREVEGVRRCLLVRRGEDGVFLGVEGDTGRVTWTFRTAPDEGQCQQLAGGASGV